MGATKPSELVNTVGYPKSPNYVTRPDPDQLKASKVLQFYKNKTILITGATGFLGKVLLWKIMDTCDDFSKIYLLMRPKKDQSAEQRLSQMLKSKPFNYGNDHGHLMNKIVAIESDMTANCLGLSESDRQKLINEVNIVFHSAASVRFDAPLKDNLTDNVYGTKSIVELCDMMKKIQAVVHVSTAYSNCNSKTITEDIYPLKEDVDNIMKIVESVPSDAKESETNKLLEGRPNTYTFTKAMAEQYVAKREGKYPVSIVRPSIVVSAAQEPCPGWVDNVNGIAGLGCLAAIGLLRTIDWNSYAKADMVPVDYVANCMICAAYQTYTYYPKKLQIYNMTSGNVNPVTWGSFFALLRKTAIETPPNKIVRPMIQSPEYRRANPIKFNLIKIFSEMLFAYMVDFILTLIGYKKILVKITKKMHHGYKILEPFTTQEWTFFSDNVSRMSDSLSELDRKLYKFDLRNFDWLSQADIIWYGSRLFLIKEEHSKESYESALKRQKVVTIAHYILTTIFLCLILLTMIAATNIVRNNWLLKA